MQSVLARGHGYYGDWVGMAAGVERLHRPVRLLAFVTPHREGSDWPVWRPAPACLAVLLCCWRLLELAVLLEAWVLALHAAV